MRKEKFLEGEYYHALNKGNDGQVVFRDQRDWARFLFLILYLQSPATVLNIGRQVDYFIKNGRFNMPKDIENKVIENRYVELVAFILMPNHFHLIIKELKSGGISDYMKRVLGGYTKYFNTKYKKSGHLFQGPFKAVYVKDDPQLLYLSAYIHKNIKEISGWGGKEELFPFSSFQDYVEKNRWGGLLKTKIILDQFPNKEKYKQFVKESSAKEKC